MTKIEFKELRKELGLTQEDFARELGVKTQTLRSWEYGVNRITSLAEKGINAVAEEITERRKKNKS